MIRKITINDFDFIHNLYMHPDTNPWLLYEIMDKQAYRSIFQDLLKRGIIYIYMDEGKDIGMFKLDPLTHRTSHIAYLGGLAINPAFAGKGYGSKMLGENLAFAKGQGFLRIELSVAVINQKAIHLYTKAGFEKEGVLRKYSFLRSEQKYLDEILMAWLFV